MHVVASTIEGKAKKLLTAMRSLNAANWHSRSDIARAAGKDRLRTDDVIVLNYLVDTGELEVMQEELEGGIPVRYLYRIRQPD